MMARLRLLCPECGKEFQTSGLRGRTPKWCSSPCREIGNLKEYRAYNERVKARLAARKLVLDKA